MPEIIFMHYVYLVGVIVILGTMAFRKDIVLPSIIFIFLIGVLATKNFFGGFQVVFNSFLFSATKFMDIILTIAMVSSLSKLLSDLNSDYLIFKPAEKIMKNKLVTFWVLGMSMYVCSLFLWPSPSVALIGAVMLPLAINSGLKPIEAAIAMNIFGHGMALSHDFIIQGAPDVTATTAGIEASDIYLSGLPLFLTMNIVTACVAFYFIWRDKDLEETVVKIELEERKITRTSKIIAVLTPLVFLSDVIIIWLFKQKGGEATSLVVGSAIILMIVGTILEYKGESFEKITEYVKYGFGFGIRIFAPVIIIGAFFFLGGEDVNQILGDIGTNTSGFLSDWAIVLADKVPLEKYSVMVGQMFIGGITGLDGSGFSGLPLVGALANTFGTAINMQPYILATLGQITAIWVGGGVLIPWAVVSVAGICDVDPIVLAKRNLIPVLAGFLATFIMACLLY